MSRNSGKHSDKKSTKNSDGEGRERRNVQFERYNVEAAEVYIVKELIFDNWTKQGEMKYGPDTSDWKFRCPKCGSVSIGKDFTRHGVSADKAYTMCIGNFNKRAGCNWTSDNIFRTMGKGVVIRMSEQSRVEVFPFAD